MEKNHLIILIVIIFFVLLIIGLSIYFSIFYKKQTKRDVALAEGYGSYSDPIYSACNTHTGNCDTTGLQKVHRHCVPHPVTNKGCLDENGNMTYQTIENTIPCRRQCIGSNFVEQNNLSMVQVRPDINDNKVVNITTGSGCNKIVSPQGIDYTNYFLGAYKNGKYQMKSCIPDGYQGYYQNTFDCTYKDSRGANNCTYKCGQYNTLKVSGLYSSRKSSDVLNYYPTELNQEGNIRHVCYNINDVNQIEVLNSTDQVPDNFVYPNRCYQHSLKYDIGVSTIYPLGTSNVHTSNLPYLDNQSYFEIDTVPDTVVSTDYNIIYDYNNYSKVIINNEVGILSNFVSKNNENSINSIRKDDSMINAYITGVFFSSSQTYSIRDEYNEIFQNKTIVPIGGYAPPGGNGFSFNLNDILDPGVCYSNYQYNGTSSYIKFTQGYLTEGSWIYYTIKPSADNYFKGNDGKLVKIEGVTHNESWAQEPGVSIAYFSQDLGPEAALYGISFRRALFKRDSFSIISPSFESNDYNPENIVISNNVLLNQPIAANQQRAYPVRYDYQQLKNNNSLQGVSFYYFGSETGTNDEGYYFPLYLTDQDPSNTHRHTFKEFPEIIFYMENGGRNHASALPPDKSLNLHNFDEFFGFASVKFYNSNGVISEAQLYQNGNYNQTYFPSSAKNAVVYIDGSPIKLNYLDFSNDSKNFIKVLRSNNSVIQFNNSVTNEAFPYVSKLKLYYQMIQDEANIANETNQEYDIIVMPEKDVVLSADFTVFKSPFLQKPDGSLESFCFDQFGRPLPSGTIKQAAANERIIVNLPCNNYNTEFPANCNNSYYGVNNQYCVQTRESNFPLFKESGTCIYNFNNYTTYKDYLEFGLDSHNPGYELKCYDQNGDIVDDKRCFPIFFTKEYKEGRVYAPNEEFFFTRKRQEYYLSLNNDNSYYPLNSEYWERIFPYQPNIDIETYQNFMIQENKSSFVFQTTNSGVMGENPFKLAVSYIYTKPQSIFLENIPNSANKPTSFTDIVNTLPNTKYYQVYQYSLADQIGQAEDIPEEFRNRGLSVKFLSDGLSAAGLTEPITEPTLIKCSFEFSYPFDSNKYSDFSVGDIFNPDFSFFNGWLNYVNASALITFRNTDGTEIPLNNSIMFEFNVKKGTNDKFFDLKTTNTITYTSSSSDTVKTNLKIGSYIYITPSLLPKKGVFSTPYGALNLLWGIYNNNNNPPYGTGGTPVLKFTEINPSYEVVLVRDIDTVNLIITVERNILNQEKINFFGYNQAVTADPLAFAGYLLTPDFKPDLNYEITKLEDGKLFFNTSNYLPAYTIENLKKNLLELTGYDSVNKKTTFGRSFNTPFLNYFYNSLTPAFSARIIKKNVTTPFITYGNNNLYLAASKDYTRLRSVLISIFSENKFNIFIEEYKDGDNSAFYVGDTILLSPSNFKLKIVDKDEFFKKTLNSTLIANKRFDYKCTLVYDSTNTAADYEQQYQQFVTYVNNKFNNYTKYINNTQGISVASALKFYGKIGTIPSTLGVKVSDPSPFSEKIVLKKLVLKPTDPGVSFITGVSFNPYAGLLANEINSYASQQILLDRAADLVYLDLVETVIQSDTNQSVILTDIQINAKPDGPTYLTNIATDNSIDRSGYGTVTGFRLSPNSLLNTNTEYYSPHGLVFRTTTKDIASYTFKDTKKIPQIKTYSIDDEYSKGDVLEFTNPNERVYYLNTSSDNTTYSQNGNSWQQVASSIYNQDPAVNFSFGDSYLKNDGVIYEGKYYTAKSNNINILPGMSTYWTEQDFSSQNDLVSNQNYFYSFSEKEDLLVSDLTQFKYQNYKSYPLGIYNYDKKKSYCPQETIVAKTHEQLNYSNSFIDQIYGVSSLGTSMGEFFIINQNKQNQVLSLITAPYTKEEFPDVKIYSSTNSAIDSRQIGQYIYSIPLDSNDPANSGRPFCIGSSMFGDSNVNYLDLANSILFSFSPLKLEDQDYPSFGTCSGLSTLVADYIGQYSPNMGTCYQFVIDEQDYNYSRSFLGGLSTSYIQKLDSFSPSTTDSLILTKNNDPSKKVTLQITQKGVIPSIFTTPSSIAIGASAGDPWYITDTTGEVVSHGYVNKDFSASSAKLEDFSNIKYHDKTDTKCNFYMINKSFTQPFNTSFIDFITGYTLDSTGTVTAGTYTNTGQGLSVYVNVDKNSKPLDPKHYIVGVSTPSIGVSFNQNFRYYSVFKPTQLKTKFFGLFSSTDFGSIRYQLDDKFFYDGNTLPALAFKPYFNTILSQKKFPNLDIITPDGTSITSYSDNYNTFILENNSTGLTLKTNFYDKPTRERNQDLCNILPKAFKNNQETHSFLISNSNKIRSLEFEDLTLQGISFVGPLETLVPYAQNPDSIPTNKTILFKNLRNVTTTYGLSNKLDCNIYTNTINDVLPSGVTYDIIYKQGPIITLNYKKYFTNKIISSFTPITLKSNVTNVFTQDDKQYPIVISRNQDTTIETSIIKDVYNWPNSSQSLIVKYFLNNTEVDYTTYTSLTFYNAPDSSPKTVRVIYNTPIDSSSSFKPPPLYLGSRQIANLTITLNLEDN